MVKLLPARPGGLLPPVLLLLPLLMASTAPATTWTVTPPGTVGAALDAAAAGDTVIVTAGAYQEQGLVLPDGVVLRAADGQEAVLATLGGAPILTCAAPGTASRVEGLVFTTSDVGFPAPVARGGGLLCEGSSPTITGCRFLGLEAGYGGAVFCAEASPVFSDCEFTNNSTLTAGGALSAVGAGSPLLTGCLLSGNAAAVSGAAVAAAAGATPSLVACTLVGHGGAAVSGWRDAAVSLERCIVTAGDAAFVGDHGSAPSFACSDIWGNGSDWTGLLAGLEGADGNLSADPLFCPEGTSTHAYALVDISPCAPAQSACGLVGARGVGCDESVGVVEGQEEETPPAGPAVTRLQPAFPNPFNPTTTVRFDLRRSGRVTVRIYDAAGRLVRRLLDEVRPAGTHDVPWLGRSDDGRTVAAGVYFIRLEGDNLIDTRRVVLVK